MKKTKTPEGFTYKIDDKKDNYTHRLEKGIKRLQDYGKKVKKFIIVRSSYTKPSEERKRKENNKKRMFKQFKEMREK